MAGMIYMVAPYERSTENVMDASFWNRSNDLSLKFVRRPKHQNKKVRASVLQNGADTIVLSMKAIFGRLGKEVQ